MNKIKKWLLLALTLSMTAALAVACGKSGSGGGTSSLDGSSAEASTPIESESSEDSSPEESVESSEESSEEVHVCITDGEWKTNSNGHWLRCTCEKLVAYNSHSGTAASCDTQPVCDTCGASYGTPPGHTYGELSDGEFGMAYYCNCGAYKTNADLVDFIVEVDDEPVVLQLSDTQTCNWGDLNTMCYDYIQEVVDKTNPDLIILTGDIVYGRFDPNGTLLKSLIAFMESLDIPWAPVFGNHDNESLMGVDWQCAQLEAAENCLFKQGDVTGNGNYSVGLQNADGELLRVFYMMDSNGCGAPMVDSNGNPGPRPTTGTNVVKTSAGFGQDQIAWYTDQINAIHAVDEDVKISFAYHIQQVIFETAFRKYDEYSGVTAGGSSSILENPLNLDTLPTADDTDFGYLGRTTKGPWDVGNAIFRGMKALGADSLFVGHEHCNSASIVYDGVRFQYGQKSSTYDRYNSLTKEGEIFGGYIADHPAGATPLIGGTVIPVSAEDGTIGTGYIAYYGDPFGAEEPTPTPTPDTSENGNSSIDTPELPEEIVVNGLGFSSVQTGVTATAMTFDDTVNAYKVTATTQGKVYIDPALVANKTTFTFTVYVPEVVNTWAIALRLKPDNAFSNITGSDGKHRYYTESLIAVGEWQTFTIDISSFGNTCTEFSFIIPAGQTVWFRDIAIS